VFFCSAKDCTKSQYPSFQLQLPPHEYIFRAIAAANLATLFVIAMAIKSVLITGCSAGGIGSALVESFQKRNLHVFATARDQTKMSHLAKLPNVTLLTFEPTSLSSVRAAVKKVEAQTGGNLDYLVNNAGHTIIMPTLDFDIDAAKSMYDINVWGMVRVTQVFAPLVIAAKGTIVNISSIATSVNTPWMGKSREPRIFQYLLSQGWRSLRRLKGSCDCNHRHSSPGIGALRCEGHYG